MGLRGLYMERKDAKKNIISHRLHRFALMKRFTQINL